MIENQIHYDLITVDDYSRYNHKLFSLYRSIKNKGYCFLSECIKQYGKPSKILVDNDTKFKVNFRK